MVNSHTAILLTALTGSFIQQISAYSIRGSPTYSRYGSQRIDRRDDSNSWDWDEPDLTWLKKWAGIGDSYAAGIGAGDRLDTSCSRWTQGYPNIMNTDARLGGAGNHTFQFLACSGATSPEILANQVSQLDSPQMVTVSAGGNDALLAPVLKACIYQIEGDCNSTLQDSQDVLDGQQLSDDLDALLSGIKAKMADSTSKIYYTGYAKFFDADSTQCDDVHFDAPIKLLTGFRTLENLTQELRTNLNNMVDTMNTKIQDAVTRAGDQVIFVDTDKYYKEFTGRFCEDGVTEPNESRPELMFYNMATVDDEETDDDDKTELRKRLMYDDPANGTFEADMKNAFESFFQQYPDAQFPDVGTVNTTTSTTTTTTNNAVEGKEAVAGVKNFDATYYIIPPQWTRVFHPRRFAQALIANLVISTMEDVQSNVSQLGLVANGCGVGPNTTSSASNPTGTALSCTGSGTGVDRDDALADIKSFCSTNGGYSASPNQGMDGQYRHTGVLNAISVNYNQACSRGDGAGYKVDETTCNAYLGRVIDDCDTTTTTEKHGGNFTDGCGVYSFTPKSTETLTCGGDPTNPTDLWQAFPRHSMDRTQALAAIDEYCNINGLYLDPTYKYPNTLTIRINNPGYAKIIGEAYINAYDEANQSMFFFRSFWPDDQTGCSSPTKFNFADNVDNCKRLLQTVIDGCDTATTTEKLGGHIIDSTASNGCVEYDMYGGRRAS